MTAFPNIINAMTNGKPKLGRGVPVGFDGYRFSVEILMPTTKNSLVDVARVGEGRVAAYEWYDLTDRCRGVQWRRGATEFGGRARTGVGTITLDVDAMGDLSSWNDSPVSSFEGLGSLLRPGTIIRWGCCSYTTGRANEWLPQFCGIVESWETTTVALRADLYATVTVVETTAALAKIDANALPGVVGGNDTVIERVARLLTASRFPYGFFHTYTPSALPIRLQSTDMANNRLSEIYLTADSGFVEIRSDQRGPLGLYLKPGPQGTIAGTPYPAQERWRSFLSSASNFVTISDGQFIEDAAFDPSTVRWVNDDAAIVNQATIGIAGQPQHTYTRTDEASVARYNGLRPFSRFDLITTAELAHVVTRETAEFNLRRSDASRRVEQVTLNHRNTRTYPGPGGETRYNAGIVMSIDIDTPLHVREIYRPKYEEFPVDDTAIWIEARGYIRALNHRVTPTPTGIDTWEVDIELDTYELIKSEYPQ